MGDVIQLLEAIQFETGKATVRESSYHTLDDVVALLKSHTDLKIAVHGHTDNRGSSKMNRKLSAERAAACVQYFVEKGGIAAERLQSAGFGPDKPVAPNDSSDGRAKNRRVEFKIVEEEEEETPKAPAPKEEAPKPDKPKPDKPQPDKPEPEKPKPE